MNLLDGLSCKARPNQGGTFAYWSMLLAIWMIGLLLAGCGGGGGGGTVACTTCDSFGQDATTFFSGWGGGGGGGDSGADGSAGDGKPIANAKVTVTDNAGHSITGTTDANGYYRVHIGGFVPPMIATVIKDAVTTRYSLTNQTPIPKKFITINITGLTTKIASDVAVTGGLSGVQALTPAALSSILTANPTAIDTAISDLKKTLTDNGMIAASGVDPAFNPITTIFRTDGTGQDLLLDKLNVTTVDGGGTYVTPVALSPLQLTKAMFAELRNTWNTASTGINSFLDSQSVRTTNDLDANISPALDHVTGRISAMSRAMSVFEDAKVYVYGTNPMGFQMGYPPTANGTTSPQPVLGRQSGNIMQAWNGTGYYDLCWTDSTTAATLTSTVTCAHAGSNSADYTNRQLKFVVFELTGTVANQYNYKATRYNMAVMFDTSGQPIAGPITLATGVPTGSGTISKTLSGTSTTSFVLNGTMPPSAPSPTTSPVTTVDTVAVSVQQSDLTVAKNFHYALTGSVATTSVADSTKIVNLWFDTGSYYDVDETNIASTGSKGLVLHLVGTAKTTATTFAGTFHADTFKSDVRGNNYQPTHAVFNGSINDTSAGGSGQIMTGILTANVTNYSSFDSSPNESESNFMQTTLDFTGTLQVPSRPLLTFNMQSNRTSLNFDAVNLTYSYGLNVRITGTTTNDRTSNIKPTLNMTNQDGVNVVFDLQNDTGTASVSGVKQADISNAVINYTDGVSESLN